jgi:hypothetical protein
MSTLPPAPPAPEEITFNPPKEPKSWPGAVALAVIGVLFAFLIWQGTQEPSKGYQTGALDGSVTAVYVVDQLEANQPGWTEGFCATFDQYIAAGYRRDSLVSSFAQSFDEGPGKDPRMPDGVEVVEEALGRCQ